MEYQDYLDMEENAAIGREIEALETSLKKEGSRCSDFLVGFGGKDADLDPEGCCGVKRIVTVDEDNITLLVGGHKTFSYDPYSNEEEWDSDNHLICMEALGVTGGDAEEINCAFEEEVVVPYVINPETLAVEEQATINAILEAAHKTCEPYQENWARVTDSLNAKE